MMMRSTIHALQDAEVAADGERLLLDLGLGLHLGLLLDLRLLLDLGGQADPCERLCTPCSCTLPCHAGSRCRPRSRFSACHAGTACSPRFSACRIAGLPCSLPGVAVHAVAFQLAMRAGVFCRPRTGCSPRSLFACHADTVAVRAHAFLLAMRAGVAVRAVEFQPAMRARVAVRALVFQLAMRARVAGRAVVFPLAVHATLASRHLLARARATARARAEVVASEGSACRGFFEATFRPRREYRTQKRRDASGPPGLRALPPAHRVDRARRREFLSEWRRVDHSRDAPPPPRATRCRPRRPRRRIPSRPFRFVPGRRWRSQRRWRSPSP